MPSRNRPSARSIQQSADQRNTARAETVGTRIGSNPNAALVERMVRTNYQTPDNPGVSPNRLTEDQYKRHQKGMELADAGNYVQAPAGAPVGSSGNRLNDIAYQRGLERQGKISPQTLQQRIRTINDTIIGLKGPVSRAGPAGTIKSDAEVAQETAANAQQVAAMEEEKAALLQQGQQQNAQKGAINPQTKGQFQNSLPKASGPATTKVQQTQPPSEGLAGLDPALQKAYGPAIGAQQNIAGLAKQELDATTADIKQEAADAEEQMEADEGEALNQFNQQLDFNKQVDDLARDREGELERQQLAELERGEALRKVEQARAEQLQRDANIDTELENRRAAAKLGINFDTGGLQWMQREVRKGTDTLSYIIQQGSLAEADYAAKRFDTIESYKLDMRQIDMQAKLDYANAKAAYDSEKTAIRNDFSEGEKSRKQMLKEARQRYYDKLTGVEKDTAALYKEAHVKMWDHQNEVAKEERAKDLELFKSAQSRAQHVEDMQMRKTENMTTRMIQFKDKMVDNLRADPNIKEFQEVGSFYSNLSAAFEESKTTKNFVGADQALINMFNKMMDSKSVVRSEEYARTADDLSFLNRMQGKIEKLQQGGPGLTQDDREHLKRMADAFMGTYTERAKRKAEGYIMQMDAYNDLVPEGFQALPDEFLPPELQTTTRKNQSVLDHYDTYQDSPSGEYTSMNIGDRKVSGHPLLVSTLQMADDDFFRETGKHLVVDSSYRSHEQQQAAYDRYKRGEIALAAAPGTSFHEKGMAVDVHNWKEAEPYLIKYGLVPLPAGMRSKDPGHFSIGESSMS